MYQVLLVDDEPVILRNISKVIDWGFLSVQRQNVERKHADY